MIFNIISNLCEEFNITMLAVSSDIKSALKYFKEFIVIEGLECTGKELGGVYEETNFIN